MGTRKRGVDRAGRAKMRSPGRPPVLHRSERRPFWQAIADGCSSEDAAQRAGVSPAVGVRWFRERGGMPPSHLAPSSPPASGRYLSLVEREQIALLRARSEAVREIARQLRRAPSTISGECGETPPPAAEASSTDLQRLADQLGVRPVAHRPADDPVAGQMHHDRQIAPTLDRAETCDVSRSAWRPRCHRSVLSERHCIRVG